MVGQELADLLVGPADVLGVAGERDPAERTLALAEERADIGLDEARIVEGVGYADVMRHLAQIVAVVEHDRAALLEFEHGPNLAAQGLLRGGGDARRVRLAAFLPLLDGPAFGAIAVDRIVRGGLIGDDVGNDAALQQLPIDRRGVAEQADRNRLALAPGRLDDCQRLVEVVARAVEIAGPPAELDLARLDLDADDRGARHGRGQRLRAAHAAQSAGEIEPAREVAAEVPAGDLEIGFVGALHDPLAADVEPAARVHLPIHGEAEPVELGEGLERRPARHDVGVGDQDARRFRVGAENSDRFAALHQQGLVGLQPAQRGDGLVETFPVPRRLADAAIDDQFLRALRDLRVEVVHQHPQGRFRRPALGRDLGAPGAANLADVPLRSSHAPSPSFARGPTARGPPNGDPPAAPAAAGEISTPGQSAAKSPSRRHQGPARIIQREEQPDLGCRARPRRVRGRRGQRLRVLTKNRKGAAAPARQQRADHRVGKSLRTLQHRRRPRHRDPGAPGDLGGAQALRGGDGLRRAAAIRLNSR